MAEIEAIGACLAVSFPVKPRATISRLLTAASHRILAAILLLAAPLSAEDWPGYRGPTGMGITGEKGLPLAWGGEDGKGILWKSPLPPTVHGGEPDHNQSSPVVVDDRVFVTTAYWPAKADKSAQAPEHLVSCYEAATGKQLWETAVAPGPWLLSDFRGGYAASTPAVADGRVFAVFGSAIVHALDTGGKALWSYAIAEHEKFDVALPTSPVVFGDTVLLLLDRKSPAGTLVALDAASGKVRWEKARPEGDFAHVTPVLADVGGQPSCSVSSTHSLQGLDPTNGEVVLVVRVGPVDLAGFLARSWRRGSSTRSVDGAGIRESSSIPPEPET